MYQTRRFFVKDIVIFKTTVAMNFYINVDLLVNGEKKNLQSSTAFNCRLMTHAINKIIF